MSHAYSNKMLAYNKEDLAKTLMFAHPKDLVEVCQHYKIETAENGIKFKKGSFDEEAALVSLFLLYCAWEKVIYWFKRDVGLLISDFFFVGGGLISVSEKNE